MFVCMVMEELVECFGEGEDGNLVCGNDSNDGDDD